MRWAIRRDRFLDRLRDGVHNGARHAGHGRHPAQKRGQAKPAADSHGRRYRGNERGADDAVYRPLHRRRGRGGKHELLALLHEAKLGGWSKHEFLVRAAQIGGIYVPSLYDVGYNEDGTVKSYTAKDGAPERVTKRIVVDFDASPYPTAPIVPSTEVVQTG